MGPFHQLKLSGYGVNGIYDIVILRKIEPVRGIRQVEERIRAHRAGRIDIQNPVSCRVYLQHAYGRMGGKDLTVDVGDADRVTVTKIQLSNAAASQGLYHITSDTAHAKNRDTGVV